MIEAVIFDIDGTLLDSNDVHAHIWHEAFVEFGKNVPDAEIRRSIGKGGDNLLPDFLSRTEIRKFGEALKKRRSAIARPYLDQLKPYTFGRDLGLKLKSEGKRVAVASSAEREDLDKMLGLVGFTDVIETKASSSDAKSSKPDPDIFLAALHRLGNPHPSNVLVVGDSPYDVTGAKRAGLRTVAVLCGGFSQASLEEAGAFATFQSPSELYLRYDQTPFAFA